MNLLVNKANEILYNQKFEYAFCGGFAIDLFLGYESRKHGDIDISVYWQDRDKIILYMQSLGFEVYEIIGSGKAHHITDINVQMKIKRNIFCCKSDCEFLKISNTPEKDIYYIDVLHIGQSKLNFIEFLFNDKTDTEFIYARNLEVKRNLEDAVLFKDGIPYLAPEICLLYKSSDTEREGYQQDYDLSIRKMNNNQIKWFNDAINLLYPEGHKWRI